MKELDESAVGQELLAVVCTRSLMRVKELEESEGA